MHRLQMLDLDWEVMMEDDDDGMGEDFFDRGAQIMSDPLPRQMSQLRSLRHLALGRHGQHDEGWWLVPSVAPLRGLTGESVLPCATPAAVALPCQPLLPSLISVSPLRHACRGCPAMPAPAALTHQLQPSAPRLLQRLPCTTPAAMPAPPPRLLQCHCPLLAPPQPCTMPAGCHPSPLACRAGAVLIPSPLSPLPAPQA
jgi:hypothetical protein